MECLVIWWLGFFGLLLIYIARERAKKAARERYMEALAHLHAHPTDSGLRTEVLRRGREYSKRARNWRGVTIFDEVALMNDLEAATAGAVVVTSSPQAKLPAAPSVEDRLRSLADLQNRGLITEAEYDDRRRRILDDL